MVREMIVSRRGIEDRFTTPYSDQEALECLQQYLRDGVANTDFAADMAGKAASGRASSMVWAWVHRIVTDYDVRLAKQVAKANNPSVVTDPTFKAIVKLFSFAGDALKRPTITVKVEDQTVRLKRAGDKSKYQGSIQITDGQPFGVNKFFGRIDPDGAFIRGRDCNPLIERILASLEKDPANFAAAYGKKTGSCCFCNRLLTDDREGHSVEVGYGPICAAHWNMPWGVKTAKATDPTVEVKVPKPRAKLTAEGEARLVETVNPAAKVTADGLVQAFGLEGAIQSVEQILADSRQPAQWGPVLAELKARIPQPTYYEFVVPAFKVHEESVEKIKFVGGTPAVRRLVNLSANAC